MNVIKRFSKIIILLLLIVLASTGLYVNADQVLTINGEDIKYFRSDEKVYIADDKSYKLEEMKGVWVATVWNGDFDSVGSVKTYKTQYEKILNNLEKMNINTILFQIRPNNDAFYKSSLNPWSQWLRGTQGKYLTDPDTGLEWDPLEYMIQETHNRGMKLFGWLNAYRVSYSTLFSGNSNSIDTETVKNKVNETLNNLDNKNFAKRNPNLILVGDSDSKIILNPGEPQVQNFVLSSVEEIVRNYDIDGVHFDDYFYLDSTNSSLAEKYVDSYGTFLSADTAFNDNYSDYNTYMKYRLNKETIANFRRRSVNNLISSISSMIKKVNAEKNSTIEFGAKPAAVWTSKARTVEGRITGANVLDYSYSSYFDIYADSLLWAENGWVDWISPQIYFNFRNQEVPYADIVKWWAEAITKANDKLKEKGDEVKLYIAHGFYRLGSDDTAKKITDSEEIKKQILFNEQFDIIQGSAFYDYSTVVSSSDVVKETITNLGKLWDKKTIPNISEYNDDIPGFLIIKDGKIRITGSLYGAILYDDKQEVIDIVYDFSDYQYSENIHSYRLIGKDDKVSETYYPLNENNISEVKSINTLTTFEIPSDMKLVNISNIENTELKDNILYFLGKGIVYVVCEKEGTYYYYMIIVNEPKYYNLTITNGTGYTIEASQETNILEGTEIDIKVNIDKMYDKSLFKLVINGKKYDVSDFTNGVYKYIVKKNSKIEVVDVELNTYKVMFDNTEKIVEYGSKVDELVISKDGYIFDGWYTDKEQTNKFSFDSLITDDIYLYSKFTKKIFNINIMIDDKIINIEKEYGFNVNKELIIQALEDNDVNVNDYSIINIYADKEEKIEYKDSILLDNLDLFIEYELKKYTITFIGYKKSTITYLVNDKITYTDEGVSEWYFDDKFTNLFDGKVTSDLTLYGRIKEVKVKIYINNEAKEYNIKYGDKINSIDISDTLYVDKDCNTLYDIESIITNDLSLYVKKSGCNLGIKLFTLINYLVIFGFIVIKKKNNI